MFLLGLGAGLIHVGLAVMLLGGYLVLWSWADPLPEWRRAAPGLQEPDGGRRGD